MDAAAIATAMFAAQAGQTQVALAAKMMRMNADQSASIVQLLEAGQQNIDRLANLAPGIGNNLDVTA